MSNPTWSGDEVSLDCAGQSTNIKHAEALWWVPTLSKPPSGQAPCNPTCGLAVWVGMEDMVEASDLNLVDAGIFIDRECGTFSCNFVYKPFYQIGANSSIQFFSCSISPGDSVSAEMDWYPDRASNNYYVAFNDNTHVCGNNAWSTYAMTPVWGAFIAERPTEVWFGSQISIDLASFTPFTIWNCLISNMNGQLVSCDQALGRMAETMYNSSSQNIGLSPMEPSGWFNETWWNSNGT